MAGKSVSFNSPRRPAPEDLDAFVHGGKVAEITSPAAKFLAAPQARSEPPATAPKVPMKRLTFDIPADLHRRMKLACVEQDRDMAEVLRELIEQRFPTT
jgi:hypothetical protein